MTLEPECAIGSDDEQCGNQIVCVFRPNLLVNACDGRSVLDGQTARLRFEW